MTFALYRRPGGVVFLDDDRDYLEMLAQVMPQDWHVRLFLRPVACIDMLLEEVSAWEEDAWRHQEILIRWSGGGALIPEILKYWRLDGQARYALTRVGVVDYSMPAMSGLRALNELTDWQGSRILLTGRADEQLAVSAFNRGLIQQFIPKQSPEIRLTLTEAIRSMLQRPHSRHQQIWRATLSRQQHALMRNADISRALDELARQKGWVEHVVIGQPFGILALDRLGNASWLQLEPEANLRELAEIARSQGWDDATVQDVSAGRALIDLELQQALGSVQKPQARKAFSIGEGAELMHAAVFDLPATLSPGLKCSYHQFISMSGERELQD
jgi:CheY-like chemotaxis protein